MNIIYRYNEDLYKVTVVPGYVDHVIIPKGAVIIAVGHDI